MDKPRAETSPGGSAILRHGARTAGWAPPAESRAMEEIENHFGRFFGPPETVLHELASGVVHIDVHVIRPRPERNWWTLFTTGMSDLPMNVPAGAEEHRFAELVLALPPEWDLDAVTGVPPAAGVERWYWPIRWMKMLARLPHEHGTWLGFGHTMPNGDPPEPMAPGTKLCGWLLLPPVTVPEEGWAVELADGRSVRLYSMHALHPEEMSLKLNEGTGALLEAFNRAKVSEVLNPRRASSVRRKLFGIF